MNRAARRRHRVFVTGLLVLLPIGMAVGLSAREPVPRLHPTDPALHGLRRFAPPPGVVEASSANAANGWSRDAELALASRVVAGPDGSSQLDLLPLGKTSAPDVLVYLTALPASSSGRLPNDAVWIGSMAGLEPRRFQLPRVSGERHITLYSLAHARLLGSMPLPAQQPSNVGSGASNPLPGKTSTAGS